MTPFKTYTGGKFEKGAPTWWRPTLLILFLFLFSCARTPGLQESRSIHLIENVPFYPQEMFQCGPAALAGVLNYWGIRISPQEIAEEIYSRSARGTLNVDMMLYTRKKGLRATQYKGSFEDIKGNIDWGYPLIVLVDYGFWVYQQNHFMIVLGYDDKGVIVHSGKERHKFILLNDFLESWKRAKFWTLRIEPKQ